MNIDLHIDELILHGFAPGDRQRIAEAVERELGRLLAEGGVRQAWAHSTEIARLDGGAFIVAPNSGTDAIGAQMAQTIYGGLSHD